MTAALGGYAAKAKVAIDVQVKHPTFATARIFPHDVRDRRGDDSDMTPHPIRTLFAAIAIAIAALVPATATAQDFMTQASDSLSSAASFAGTVAVNSHLKGARQGADRAVRTTRQQRVACAGLHRHQKRYGADHPRVVQLERHCRASGLAD